VGQELSGVLAEFTLINIVICLAYGQDKSFDIHALRAYKSLKAYKYFYDGYTMSRVSGCSSVPVKIN